MASALQLSGHQYPRRPIYGYRLLNEPSWLDLLKALWAEYIMTAAFIFLAVGVIVSGCKVAGGEDASITGGALTVSAPPGSCFLGTSTLLNIALAFGFAMFIAIFAAASFSGGHINPAVTFAFILTRKVSIVRGVLYINFQCLGACTGSTLIYLINEAGFHAAAGGINQLAPGVKKLSALGLEVILTFFLVFVVFAASATDSMSSVTDSARKAYLPILAPLAVGTTVFLANLVAVPIDGCSINPARSFGPAATFHSWKNHWIFWIGPLLGASLAAVAYSSLLMRQLRYEAVEGVV